MLTIKQLSLQSCSTVLSLAMLGILLVNPTHLLANESADDEIVDVPQRLEPEVIRLSDNLGSIEEQRVRGIESEIRVIPRSGGGYLLISPSDSDTEVTGGSTQSVHRDDNQLLIPSWQLFSW